MGSWHNTQDLERIKYWSLQTTHFYPHMLYKYTTYHQQHACGKQSARTFKAVYDLDISSWGVPRTDLPIFHPQTDPVSTC